MKTKLLLALTLLGVALAPAGGRAEVAIRSCDVYCPTHPASTCTCPLYTERAGAEVYCDRWTRSCWLE